MADKKFILTLVVTIAVTLGVGAAAIIYGPAIIKSINETPVNTNETFLGNTSSFQGNITNITSFDNGTYVVVVQAPVSAEKDKQYQDNIIAALKKKAGQFSNICTITITTKDNANPQLVYSKPNSIACQHLPPTPVPTPPPIVNETPPIPVPPPIVPPIINNTKDNNTIPNPPTPVPVPPTPPIPEGNKTLKVILTGDIGTNTDSMNVFNAIKAKNPDNVVILGDLGYGSDLSWFKKTYGSLGNKVSCVLGNHESENEDGTAKLQTEAAAYCTNSYYFKKNHVLFLGFNTNGDLSKQGNEAVKLLTNPSFMTGIKSVHIMSHKPCAVAPNAHHPLEIKGFCDFIKSNIPTGVKQYYDQAHNHVMSSSADGTYKTIGAGGKSHYTCGVSAAFPFCDNGHFGYLQYDIKPDGTTTSAFYDYKGSIVK